MENSRLPLKAGGQVQRDGLLGPVQALPAVDAVVVQEVRRRVVERDQSHLRVDGHATLDVPFPAS
jgi:hypothetical protein